MQKNAKKRLKSFSKETYIENTPCTESLNALVFL